MSRIGKQPISIPTGVNVTINDRQVTVNGTKGSLTQNILEGIEVNQEVDSLIVSRVSDEKVPKANHGLMRSLINNMVIGVSQGFSKKLEIVGVGYRVSLQGNGLKLNLGYSHDINFPLPEGINANIEQSFITVSGINKQQVGQVASEIRALRKPEPYKGKGIKYDGEYIIRKSGKSGKEK
jgi:large subunit ribosomal protein L6